MLQHVLLQPCLVYAKAAAGWAVTSPLSRILACLLSTSVNLCSGVQFFSALPCVSAHFPCLLPPCMITMGITRGLTFLHRVYSLASLYSVTGLALWYIEDSSYSVCLGSIDFFLYYLPYRLCN